ncbi:MAG: TRAP transporter substrate-binding protein DctP [Gammaproteobacteria bacterium]|jgi:TRAP-type C4-dicarboxylate transport system substrate-binding protein|nr:TRAP transporter substrate-binding protein DctP [Gammaproteobacteria bacterium]
MIFSRAVALAGAGALSVLLSFPVQADVFKIATVAPEGSEWMDELRAAAADIKDQTEGRVEFKFYGGGVMGTDKKVLRKIRIGQLQGAAFTTSGLADRYFDIMVYGLPFLFRSQAEVDYVRERMDDRLLAGLEEAGLVSFGFAGGGFANFMSNTPITSHEMLRTKNIWVPEGDVISFSALESMNLSPVVLPLADVMTGLQTGLLDIIVTPPVGALLLQWYTKVGYINPVPIAYTMGTLAVDKRAFDRLSDADQVAVRDIMGATYARLDVINRSDNVEAQDALLANGLEIVESSPADVPYWRSVALETNQRLWQEGAVDPGLYADVLALLEEFRSSNAVAATAENEG